MNNVKPSFPSGVDHVEFRYYFFICSVIRIDRDLRFPADPVEAVCGRSLLLDLHYVLKHFKILTT